MPIEQKSIQLFTTLLRVSKLWIKFAQIRKFTFMANFNLGIGSRVRHPQFGLGVVIQVLPTIYEIAFIDSGIRQVIRDFEEFEVIEAVETPSEILTYEKIEKSLIRILRRYSDIQESVEIGQKWKNGKIILRPGESNLKEKEIAIETFFHKIVMTRDRLRVMEQKINSSKLDDDEKIELQQYITRIYGSLTTFNVLFKNKEDFFVGEKSN